MHKIRFSIFSLLIMFQYAHGMRKVINKLKPAKKHHSDKKRSLREAWSCECDMCAESMRIEREAHEAERIKLERVAPALTPEQVEEHEEKRKREQMDRMWQLRLAEEKRMVDEKQKPKKKWGITIGVAAQRPPVIKIAEEHRDVVRYLLSDPYQDDSPMITFEGLLAKPPRMSFSDDENA